MNLWKRCPRSPIHRNATCVVHGGVSSVASSRTCRRETLSPVRQSLLRLRIRTKPRTPVSIIMTTTAGTPLPAHELYFEPKQLPRLRSNHGGYIDPASVGWMRPTPKGETWEEIRRRFEEDGYVWVKGVIPREEVLKMREHYFAHMAETGILKPGTHPRDGIFDETADPIAHNGVGGRDLPEDIRKVNKLIEAHTTDVYRRFLEHQDLRKFVQDFMGWKKDVLVGRTLLR